MKKKVIRRLGDQGLSLSAEDLDRMRQHEDKQDWERWYSQSGGGKIFQEMEKLVATSGAKISVDGRNTPCEVFHYGGEKASLIKHVEQSGDVGVYVRLSEMQKQWWRNSLANAGYTRDKLHIIDMTIVEGVRGVDSEAGDALLGRRLAAEFGVNIGRIGEIQKAVAEAVAPIVEPDFTVQLSDGGGDFREQFRIVPSTAEVAESCINVKDPYVALMREIVTNFDGIKGLVGQKLGSQKQG